MELRWRLLLIVSTSVISYFICRTRLNRLTLHTANQFLTNFICMLPLYTILRRRCVKLAKLLYLFLIDPLWPNDTIWRHKSGCSTALACAYALMSQFVVGRHITPLQWVSMWFLSIILKVVASLLYTHLLHSSRFQQTFSDSEGTGSMVLLRVKPRCWKTPGRFHRPLITGCWYPGFVLAT